jgi:signal transduction histidine kinase
MGVASLGTLRSEAAFQAIVAISRKLAPGEETNLVLQRGAEVLHGAVRAERIVLADGRPGMRMHWVLSPRPEPARDIALQAQAFEAAPIPMAVVGDDGVPITVNRAYSVMASGGVIDRADLLDEGWTVETKPLSGMAGLSLASFAPPSVPGAAVVEAAALARIAHEFRSPLTAVLGFAEFLAATLDEMPIERAKGYLADLSTAAERMRRLADDLVGLGSGKAGLRVAETALDPLLATALRLATPAAEAKGVALSAPAPSGLVVLADADALGRAVANLLDNAIRHGARRGGTISVRIVDSGKGDGTSIVVADDGPGLDKASLAEALMPYGRPGERDDLAAGGLGLPIVREIAEAHGGELLIETAPGQGFTARLHLPAGRVFRVRAR